MGLSKVRAPVSCDGPGDARAKAIAGVGTEGVR